MTDDQDEDFLKHEVVPTLMETVGVSQYYGVKELLRDQYFDPGNTLQTRQLLDPQGASETCRP